jgi:hypothetical protein
MKQNLRHIYLFVLFFSLLACIYSFFVPGISKPDFPSTIMRDRFLHLNSHNLLSVKGSKAAEDTSDRKISTTYSYSYTDGSNVIATVVRVRKRDDFKIETYGLLTKGISTLYIKNPRMTNSIPHSIYGSLNNRDSFQTCIIPGTKTLDKVDIRLNSLTANVEDMDTTRNNLFSKVLGTEKVQDYSCLVLIYQPSPLANPSERSSTWNSIIELAQMALAR